MAPLFSLQIRNKLIHFQQPAIMAVVNLTPDSFYDGGKLFTNSQLTNNQLSSNQFSSNYKNDAILHRVEKLINDGAHIIDLGAESTRPGAKPISSSEQIDRLGNSIEAIKQRFDILVSIDTSSPEVISAADNAQADIINDVRALQINDALTAMASTQMAIVLMHMQGQPDSMQKDPHYAQPVEIEVRNFLQQRILDCQQAGIALSRIAIDPGFGFGKTLEQNLQLLRQLRTVNQSASNESAMDNSLNNHQFPILAGLSRKSMIAAITGSPVQDRLPESLALSLIAVQNGAHIVRVHDVLESANVLAMWHAINQPQ